MKKILILILSIILVGVLTSCSSESQTSQPAVETVSQNSTDSERPEGGNQADGDRQPEGQQTIGLVTDIVGNELTINVGEMENGMSGSGGSEGGFQGGERPEGTTEGDGERPEEMTEGGGERPEGMTEGGGERPEGMTEGGGERPEGMTEGGGERPEGMTEGGGERPEGMTEGGGERSEGMTGGGGMSGGMGSNQSSVDYSEQVTLTDEIKSYSIPVTTPVTQFGTEMTFSQITEDMYISIRTDDDDNVLSINILG